MIVADNSVATKWVFSEDLSDLAQSLLAEQRVTAGLIVVPQLLAYEFTNVVLKRIRRDGLTLAEGIDALELFQSFPLEVLPRSSGGNASIRLRALEIAATYGLSATYDAHYVALAEYLRCDLWTADSRLIRELGNRLPYVRSLDSFVPSQ